MDDEQKEYSLTDIVREDIHIYGTNDEGVKLKLAANKMLAVELTDQLNELADNEGTLSYPVGPSLDEDIQLEDRRIDAAR